MATFNAEAEKNLLSCVLYRQGLDEPAEDLLTSMTPDDFYIEQNRELFGVMHDLHKKGMGLDVATLTDEIDRKQKSEKIGGMTYISEVLTAVPSNAGYKQYRDIVKDHAKRRMVIRYADYLKQQATGEKTGDALIIEAEDLVSRMAMRDMKSDLRHISCANEVEFQRLQRLAKGEYDQFGLRTGFRELDNALWGLQKSDLIVLAARPGVGKTAFALNIIKRAAMKDLKTCAFFSLEMSEEQITKRLYSIAGGIDNYVVKSGKGLDMSEAEMIRDFIDNGRLYIDDLRGNTVPEMMLKAKRLQRMAGLDLIVVDYLQIVRPARKSDNRVQEVGEIARGLKSMARQLNVPVIALCQLNRKLDRGESGKPQAPVLSDLRESGEIENEADIVAFLTTESRPEEAEKTVYFTLAKFRNGHNRSFRFSFTGSTFTFSENPLIPVPKKQLSDLEALADEENPF